ncbi:MAG TPA: urate hydroxylase PuuD [Candidatus Binatia bacterium]
MLEGNLGLMILRWLHFLFGIAWIGLLYYFNFVQVPFFAETDAATKNAVTQKLVPRALWWFRWGGMGTFIVGLMILLNNWSVARSGFIPSSYGAAILTGGILGTIMFLNVWLVIWPNQKVVIASAVAVAGGGQADPAVGPAGRRAFLTSRTNTMFSVPMLFFMGAARHYPHFSQSRGGVVAWVVLCGGIVAFLEYNALVGTQGPMKKPLETISGVIRAGIVLTLVLFLILRFL